MRRDVSAGTRGGPRSIAQAWREKAAARVAPHKSGSAVVAAFGGQMFHKEGKAGGKLCWRVRFLMISSSRSKRVKPVVEKT
jgi:hypothetical protein